MWNQHRSCSPLFQSFSAPDGSFLFHFHSTGFRKVIARSFSLCCQQLFWIYTIIYHDCNIIANAFQEILLVKATSFLLLVLDKKPPKIPPNMGRILGDIHLAGQDFLGWYRRSRPCQCRGWRSIYLGWSQTTAQWLCPAPWPVFQGTHRSDRNGHSLIYGIVYSDWQAVRISDRGSDPRHWGCI